VKYDLRAAGPAALVLVLATFAAALSLSWLRPPLRLDVGEGRDHLFLRGFHDRETAADGETLTTTWPVGAAQLSLPGGYDGIVLARLVAAPAADRSVIARNSAVTVNGVRVAMPRRSEREIWAKVPAELAAAPTLTFALTSALNGDPLPPADQIGAVELAPAVTYRWTTADATITLPHLGRGAQLIELRALVRHSDGSPVNAMLTINGQAWATLTEADAPRRYQLLAPAALIGDGTVELGLTAEVFRDPRPLGLLLFDLRAEPLRGGSIADGLPSLRSWLVLLISSAALTLVTAAVLHELPVGPRIRRGLPSAIGVLATLAAAAHLNLQRLPDALMLDRVALLSVFAVMIAWPLQAAVRRLLRQVDAAPPQCAVGALLGLFWLGFVLKGVGMLTPAYMGVDVFWHMDKVRDILFGGALPSYYGVNSPLNDITMPTAEWGSNPPVIPYSPWFHLLATVYALFPWPMELTASMVALLMDLSRIPLVAAMTRTVSRDWRAPLLAAATMTVLPVTFLLHNWGNVPTAAGLWLSWLVIALVWIEWPRLQLRSRQIALALLLTLTFLIYTVTGVFTGVWLVLLTLLVLLNARRGTAWAAAAGGLRPLWTAAGAAIAAALVIYYGQYIQPIVTITLPYLATMLTAGPQSVGVERPSFLSYLAGFWPHLGYWRMGGSSLYYGLLLPLLALPFGYRQLRGQPVAWLIASAWGSVSLLFFLVGYRVDMVDKQLFFLIPLAAITGGLVAERIWRRGAAGRLLVVSVLILTLLSALWLWAYRIDISPIYYS
jgi:hypothetical protein